VGISKDKMSDLYLFQSSYMSMIHDDLLDGMTGPLAAAPVASAGKSIHDHTPTAAELTPPCPLTALPGI
jgi:hypothetical protein